MTDKHYKIVFLVLFLLGSIISKGNTLDSLNNQLKFSDDTTKVDLYLSIGRKHMFSDVDTALYYVGKADSLMKTFDSHFIDNWESFNELKGLMYSYFVYGYATKGNYFKAIELSYESLKFCQKTGDKELEAVSLINLADLHLLQEDTNKAIEVSAQAVKVAKGTYPRTEGGAYAIYGKLLKYNDLDSSLFYLLKAKQKYKIADDKVGEARILNEVALIYNLKNDYKKVLENALMSIELARISKDNETLINNYVLLANKYLAKKEYLKAKAYADSSYVLAKKNASNTLLMISSEVKFTIYQDLKDTNIAYIFLKEYIKHKTKVDEQKYNNEAVRLHFSDEYSRKLFKKEHEQELKNQKEKQLLWFFSVVIILLLIFGFIVYRRMKIARKQRKIIFDQKIKVDNTLLELEEKNKEVLDSIVYAKRIQSAILPSDKLFNSSLPNSFIIYKPKDIVAGDFYWLEHKNDKILFAAADCTGHGVPGAMVSVICNNGLNRSVREYDLSDPGKILDKTREIVLQEFEKSEEEVKDGMDIALCSIEGNELKYAGAHNPLWIIRENEVIEIKANKQPIGKFETPIPYITHSIDLIKGDSIYVFSDGYADQFGGEKGKKFKTANFKKLLLSIQNETMAKQCKLIDNAFEDWKGKLEQLDDVCVIGVRI